MAHQPVIQPFSVQLRNGTASDLDGVMEIMTRAFRSCFGEGWTRSQCAGILPLPGVALTLACLEGQPVGFALRRRILDESELLLLATDPGAQRQGVATALLDDFIESSRLEGASRLHLEVRDGNLAVALYSRAGFVICGRRSDYYRGSQGDHYDALTMLLTKRND